MDRIASGRSDLDRKVLDLLRHRNLASRARARSIEFFMKVTGAVRPRMERTLEKLEGEGHLARVPHEQGPRWYLARKESAHEARGVGVRRAGRRTDDEGKEATDHQGSGGRAADGRGANGTAASPRDAGGTRANGNGSNGNGHGTSGWDDVEDPPRREVQRFRSPDELRE